MIRYQIQTQYDVSAGAVLTVRFPEADMDHKALYTLQADWPEFLVPFRYRSVDGYAECSYELANRSKLQYRFGNRPPKEYVEFWTQVLQPLLDCDDWFLKPLSFVLDPDYLYIDKAGKTISYLYIPAVPDCVGYEALREMVTVLSQKNSTTDQQLENQVLRAIMQDFNPRVFLQMLRESQSREAGPRWTPPAPKKKPEDLSAGLYPEIPGKPPKRPGERQPAPDDVVVHLDNTGGKRPDKKEEKQGGIFGFKKTKEPKPSTAQSPRTGLFGGKEAKQPSEIVLGAGAPGAVSPAMRRERDLVSMQPVPPVDEDDEVTKLTPAEVAGRCLRLASNAPLPQSIPVDFQGGLPFTIGRFDVSVGMRQSSFEFDKQTEAVSRHHAAIEQGMDGVCQITDLSSSAGTFINGKRLTPNVPHPLLRGDRISFGTCGADYIWEE